MKKYIVSESIEIVLDGETYLLEVGDEIVVEAFRTGYEKRKEQEEKEKLESMSKEERAEYYRKKNEKREEVVAGEDDDWPKKVKKGGLRERMGLDPNKSLEDQASPEKVAKFFKSTDEDGRGKVMYAVNSNKTGNPFWKKVGKLIKPED